MMASSSNFDRTKFDLYQIDQFGQFDLTLVFEPQQVKKLPNIHLR